MHSNRRKCNRRLIIIFYMSPMPGAVDFNTTATVLEHYHTARHIVKRRGLYHPSYAVRVERKSHAMPSIQVSQ
jgi:hypothetical protein